MYKTSYHIKIRKTAVLLAAVMTLFSLSITFAQEVTEVTATGFAPSTAADPRGEALASALREAVRAGTRIDIASSTKVKDFVLEHDEVLTRAFGYVREYDILHSGWNEDGDYSVSVRAKVGEGDPEINDQMAIKMLLKRKKSPKISLEIDEKIGGIDGETDFARSWLTEASRDLGLSVIDEKRHGRHQRRMAGKDALFGDDLKANIREANVTQVQDYILYARIDGEYAGPTSFYGSEEMHEFDVQVELSVVRPDTGETLVSVTMPPDMFTTSTKRTPRMAAGDIIRQKLDGREDTDAPNGYAVFHKLLAQWITELDLGRMVTLEFYQFTNDLRLQLVEELKGVKGISAVLPGEFDARAFSLIDVETRLDVDALAKAVEEKLGKDYQLQVRNTHSLRFVPAEQMP